MLFSGDWLDSNRIAWLCNENRARAPASSSLPAMSQDAAVDQAGMSGEPCPPQRLDLPSLPETLDCNRPVSRWNNAAVCTRWIVAENALSFLLNKLDQCKYNKYAGTRLHPTGRLRHNRAISSLDVALALPPCPGSNRKRRVKDLIVIPCRLL